MVYNNAFPLIFFLGKGVLLGWVTKKIEDIHDLK